VGEPPLIKLDDALSGVSRLAIDTSPFIYFIERHPDFIDVVRELFRRIDSGMLTGCTSMVTLVEVFTKPFQAGNPTLQREYQDLLLHSRNLATVSIGAVIAEEAARLRATQQLRTPDALQIATAIQQGCQAILTNDHRLRHASGIQVLVLSDIAR
jgi:predicted nucleic acid-binding protein